MSPDLWTVAEAGSQDGDGIMQIWTFDNEEEALKWYGSLSIYGGALLFRGLPLKKRVGRYKGVVHACTCGEDALRVLGDPKPHDSWCPKAKGQGSGPDRRP